jgi:hypothetical protein
VDAFHASETEPIPPVAFSPLGAVGGPLSGFTTALFMSAWISPGVRTRP